MNLNDLPREQQRQLEAILNSSEEALLFEIANTLHRRESSSSSLVNAGTPDSLSLTMYWRYDIVTDLEEPNGSTPDFTPGTDNVTDVEYVDPDRPDQTPICQLEPIADAQRLLPPPGLEQARELVRTSRLYLYSLLCDPTTQKPTDWATDAATGHVKDVIAAAVSVLMSSHCTEVAVAIPVAVLLLKKGLFAFCSEDILKL